MGKLPTSEWCLVESITLHMLIFLFLERTIYGEHTEKNSGVGEEKPFCPRLADEEVSTKWVPVYSYKTCLLNLIIGSA